MSVRTTSVPRRLAGRGRRSAGRKAWGDEALLRALGNRRVRQVLREGDGHPTLGVAVARSVASRRSRPSSAERVVQRCGTVPADRCPCHDADRDGTSPGADTAAVHRQAGPREEEQEQPPRLRLSDEQLREVLGPSEAERVTSSDSVAGPHGREDAGLPQPCLPANPTEPWMPASNVPLPIELGEGTRRHPKLKYPHGPSGPGCRGACGPGCPSTCGGVGTYEEAYRTADGCSYVIEFRDGIRCGTHEGCRHHDAEFDIGKGRGEGGVLEPEHAEANAAAWSRWGPANTTSWMLGKGPYDAWWYFVEAPVIKESRGSTEGGPPISYRQVTAPLFDPSSPMTPQERIREFDRLDRERDPARPSWEIVLPLYATRF